MLKVLLRGRFLVTKAMSCDWVVIDYSKLPNELWCKRCNVRQKFPEGAMAIDIYVAIIGAFVKLHKNCKERK